MKTLALILLFLSFTSLKSASATERNIREVHGKLLRNRAAAPETKVSHCPRETPLPLVDPQTPSDEIQYSLSQGASSVVNSRSPAALPSLVHITQNSLVLCALENISVSEVAQVSGSPAAVEDSGDAHTGDREGKESVCGIWTRIPSRMEVKGHRDRNLGSINAPHGWDIGDCIVGYDHQSIVVLGEDPLVMESASFLYEKCPCASTLLRYQKGMLQLVRGSHTRLTKNSHLVLVGHGSRGREGLATMGGYLAEEVAMVVAAAMETEGGYVRAVSLVGCELGKDLRFATRLLQALRSLRLETKLHLYLSPLSITRFGVVLTQEKRGRDPPIWRHQDSTTKVIALLEETGTLVTRVAGLWRGHVVPGYHSPTLQAEPSEWPTHPQMFIPAELRAKYPSIDCLEGLTWSLFYEENAQSRASDYMPDQRDGKSTLVWLSGQKPAGDPPIKHIVTILDLVREIRYVAKENVNFDLYYALNDCVYKVQKRTLYVSITGKYVDSNVPGEALRFTSAFEGESEHLTLPELRQGLKASNFNVFCRWTFQFGKCEGGFGGDSGGCERWGRYFMAAVFSESVRNFRTFALFLMSVVACEVSHLGSVPGDRICGAFVDDDHPMVGVGTWLERDKRGFYGCSLSTEDVRTRQDKLARLELVLHKENTLFSRTSACMTRVYGQQNDAELDIFGKVKVVNQYSYASFIEYFRGTKEGRKLSRGCMSSL